MKKSLNVYMEHHPPRKNTSKLFPFYLEMQAMREKGYSYRQLSEALLANGIKAYPSEIKRYLDRKSSVKSNIKAKKVESSKQTVSQFFDTEPKG